MSQYDFGTINPSTKSGTALATDLNSWRTALHSGHAGAARPAYAIGGMTWIKQVSSTNWEIYLYDGDTDILVGAVNPTTNAIIPATIAAGGTNSATASAARTALGLAIGTDVMAYAANNMVGQASSVDSEIGLFSGTGGATLKRATGTGFVKVVSGVYQTPAATIGTSEVANDAITLAKMQNAAANSKLLGAGSAGSGADYAELTLGTNLSMSGTTLNAAGGQADLQTPLITHVTAQTSGTTVMPFDNSIPQNTEGDQYFSQAITPVSATSRIRLQWSLQTANSSSGQDVSMGLFVDSTANALAAMAICAYANGHMWPINGSMSLVAGSTTLRTYKIRIGGTGGTTYINGWGTQVFGGVSESMFEVREIPA